MLDTRSGQLLTSQSFKEAFSQLQFAGRGLSYLLHKSHTPSQELIELHHMDLSTNTTKLVTSYTHAPHTKTRPSLWRGSLSPDGSLLAYQQDVLVPSITVTDARDGKPISQIHWEEDLTPLRVHIDPLNELIVVSLAQWDAKYSYGPNSKLLVANLKTGRVLGQYKTPDSINHVRFQGDRLVLIDYVNKVGHLTVGSPSITWKTSDEIQVPGSLHQLLPHAQNTAYFSRKSNVDTGEFRLLHKDCLTTESRIPLEKGYVPVGLRGEMLVSEKYTVEQLPGWLQKVNERASSLCGRYLVSPLDYSVRYQNAATGELLAEHRFEERTVNRNVSNRITGASKLASIYQVHDHLSVEFFDVFPYWTTRTIALLAVVLTLLISYSKAGWEYFVASKKMSNGVLT